MTSAPDHESADSWPSVSVVMPVLNEERHLGAAVQMVLGQDYAGPLEIVLALGPSTDGTQAVAERLAAEDDRVRLVDNPSGRTPDALNAAIRVTRGEIVARVDGHAEIPPDYLRQAVAELAATGADNVGGIMDAQGITAFQRAVACAMKSRLGVGSSRFHTGGMAGEADTVYLGVFRRAALVGVGGYDRVFARAQDWELNHRIRQAGGKVWFTPKLRVTYRPRGNPTDLGRQYFYYGRWRHVVARRHRGTTNARYLAAPLMVTATSAATVVGLFWAPALAVPAAYGLGITVGGALISAGEPIAVRALTPVALGVMHWAWGIGYLTSPRSLGAPR